MSSHFSLQADVTNIPQGALSLLGALTPILRALSADNVSPLAVVQLEAIGRYFPMSGPLAKQVPDALTRSRSIKLERLQTTVGWMAGDTTSALAQTAGGQAAALLTLGLVEMFCRNSTGHLLFELSMKILPIDQCLASMAQLSDLAEIVSNKLEPLAFGHHHAVHLTRIRETYLYLNIEMPRSTSSTLLDRLTVESMVGLLDAVQQALRGESFMVYIEGFKGLGGIIAILMGLCPNDILLLVENGIIFEGKRRSIVISVLHERETTFTVEEIIRDDRSSSALPVFFRDDGFPANASRISPYDHISMKIQHCLADMVDQIFVAVTFRSTRDVVVSFVKLIAAIVCSFTGSDFGPNSRFPRGGLRSLLGPHTQERIRDKLALLYGTEPAMDNLDPISAYNSFRQSVNDLVPESACLCSQCCRMHSWAAAPEDRDTCPILSIWGALRHLVGYSVLLSFVDTDLETLRIIQHPRVKMGPHLCQQLIRRTFSESNDSPQKDCGPSYTDEYSILDLHNDLCQLFGSIPSNAGDGHNTLGTSSGAVSIFPSTLETISFNQPRIVLYRVLDGQFCDRHNYYKALIEDARNSPRPTAEISVLHPRNTISPSRLGAHSHVTLSVRPYHNSLAVRTMVGVQDKIINLSFHTLQLAYMNTSIASPCNHDHSLSVNLLDTDFVITTGLGAPLASMGRISMVLTHGSPEAQFLAGVPDVQALFQGRSCLECMIREAKDAGYWLLIQS
ncbi:hypothetical protein EG329_011374 [Mollisiaceae sp. DMI_Dod_QoI]|nr:hypothetical protein EG329_011374 [Helotiales sp. DMI_Dod_QoI]